MDLDDLMDVYGTYFVHDKFPRPLADGLVWIGGCSALFLDPEKPDLVHSALNTYLVLGSEKTLLVDTGHPALWPGYAAALKKALAGRPLDYVVPTHPEVPHAGSLTMLYRRWPNLKVAGDTRDYFLYHPDVPANAYVPVAAGGRIDLGDREFELLPALFKDLPNTVWGFDHGSRTLFPADGFAFFHWHSEQSCGMTAEEFGVVPDAEKYSVMTEIVSGVELLDLTDKIEAFQQMVRELQPSAVAPAHGTVVTNVGSALNYLTALREVSRTSANVDEQSTRPDPLPTSTPAK